MVRHIVSWNFKPELTPEERREAGALLVARVNALKELIPFALEVKAFCPPLDSSSCDFVLYSEVPQASDLPLYQNHPEHQAVHTLIQTYLSDLRTSAIDGKTLFT